MPLQHTFECSDLNSAWKQQKQPPAGPQHQQSASLAHSLRPVDQSRSTAGPPQPAHSATMMRQLMHKQQLQIEQTNSAAPTTVHAHCDSPFSAGNLSSASASGFGSPTPSSAATSPANTPSAKSPGANLFSPIAFTPSFSSLAHASLSPMAAAAASSPSPPLLPPPALHPALPCTPIHFSSRFRIVRPLQNTLFGSTVLCQDLSAIADINASADEAAKAALGPNSCLVVVKRSNWAAIERKFEATTCLEDVRSEARLHRWLGVARPLQNDPSVPIHFSVTPAHIDPATCGLSPSFLQLHTDPTTGLLRQHAVDELAQGARFIAPLHGEWDSQSHRPDNAGPVEHYLATGFGAGGDLFDVICKAPNGRLSESDGRKIFAQLLQAVQWLHARSVAHLDLSVENVCIDEHGDVKLIDLGLAIVHGRCTAAPLGGQSVSSCTTPLQLASEDARRTAGMKYCNCETCFSSPQQLAARVDRQIDACSRNFPALTQVAIAESPLIEVESPAIPALRAESPSGCEIPMDIDCGNKKPAAQFVHPTAQQALKPRCAFLMRPICATRMRPGKPINMPPELVDCSTPRLHAPWDAYASDIFALGTLLFVMLCGRKPFDVSGNRHFHWLISGKWRTEWRTHPTPGIFSYFTHLSPNAMDLIDRCCKPQHLRPSIDEIRAHPFMNDTHTDSVPAGPQQ